MSVTAIFYLQRKGDQFFFFLWFENEPRARRIDEGNEYDHENRRAYVNVLLKVDENSPIRFTGKLFSDSYTAGFVRITPSNTQVVRKYISQAISGTKVKVRVHNDRKSEIEDYAVLLAGFTKHTAAALKACEISAAESEMNTQDQARLEEIEAEVSRLEREKQNILSKYWSEIATGECFMDISLVFVPIPKPKQTSLASMTSVIASTTALSATKVFPTEIRWCSTELSDEHYLFMQREEKIETDIRRLASRSFRIGAVIWLLLGLIMGLAVGYGQGSTTNVIIPLTSGTKT